jgi:hypothetical protein
MQNISGTLATAIQGSAHSVSPFVEAEWVNGRSLSNIKASSTSDDYTAFVESLNPALYLRLNDSFDVVENMNTGPKPSSHWRMNNAVGSSGTVIADEMGYNNLQIDTAATAGTSYILGQAGVVRNNDPSIVNYGINFTTANSSNARAQSYSADLSNKWSIVDNPNFSFECWIKPDNGATLIAAGKNIVAYKTGLRSAYALSILELPEWSFMLDNPSASAASTAYPRFVIMNNSGNMSSPSSDGNNLYMDLKSTTAISAGLWSHIVVTYDSKDLKMYINNVLVGTASKQNGNIIDIASGTLYIASAFQTYSTYGAGTPYRGYIDEIALYQDCLSFADVSRRWKSGSLNIPARSASDAIYKNIKDFSTNGRNGYVTGPAQLEFLPKSNGVAYSPLSGRIDDGGVKFVNTGSPRSKIGDMYLTSDGTSTGTSIFSGNNLTVSCSIYITDSATISQEIAGMGDGTITAANRSWMLGVNKNVAGTATISANIYSSTVTTTVTSASITANAWHHILMTVGSDNKIYLMIDGDYAGAVSSTVMATTMNTNAAWPTSVGYLTDGQHLSGVIVSEFMVLNTNVDLRFVSGPIKSMSLLNDYKSINRIYNPLQVVNGKTENTVPWAVLDALDENGRTITADGDYYFTERNEVLVDTDYEYGWWSKVKSDGSGNFAVPQSIYLTFDAISANYVDLYSSLKYGPIKSGSFYYQLDSGTWMGPFAFTVDSASKYIYSIGSTVKIKALHLFVSSTLYPLDNAKIEEFAPRFTEDISSYVSTMEVDKVRENFDSSVPLGATGANTCNLTLDNTSKRFNLENSSSDLYGLIFPGVKFTVGYKYATSSGSSPEYIQEGIFYSDNWNLGSDNMTASIQCRDFSGKMQDSMVVDGYLSNEVTAAEAIADLALRSGVPASKVIVDNNYSSEIIKDAPDAYWRFNETQLEPFALNFDGNVYLYSHPFADLLMTPASGNVTGAQVKNTTYASTKVLPRTFYDFPDSELTLEFWIKCAIPAAKKTVMNYATKRYANEFSVNINTAGKIETRILTFAPGTAVGAGTVSTAVVADSLWHHVAIVVDPTIPTTTVNKVQISYYIDGVVDNTFTVSTFDGFKPSGQMLIGAGFTAPSVTGTTANGPNTLDTTSIFSGALKEIKLWGTARSQSQIRTYMNSPIANKRIGAHSSNIYKNMITAAAPVAYYPMDLKLNLATTASSSKPLIRDISGFDRNATIFGSGFTSVPGPIISEDSSSAIKFKASNTTSYITASNTSITPYEGTQDGNIAYTQYDFSLLPSSISTVGKFTFEAWVNPTSRVLTPIASKTSASVDGKEWDLSIDTNGSLSFNAYASTAPTSTVISSVSAVSNALPLNAWSHIAVTVGGSKVQMYINGRTVTSSTNFFTAAIGAIHATALAAPFRIGVNNVGTAANSYASTISIAHVAVYQRVLPAIELYSHYSKAGYDSAAADSSSDGRLLYYWPLNQGRFFEYEDFKQSGFAYKSAARGNQNICPNVTKFSNHMYAYTADNRTSNLTSQTINQSLWMKSGVLAVKDYASDKNYLTYRMGAAAPYDEKIDANKISPNFGGPLSSEAERSTKFSSALNHVAYLNYTTDLPMTVSSTSPLSMEMWINPTSVASKQYLFSREDFGATNIAGSWRIFLDSDSKVKFEIHQTSGATLLAITPTTFGGYPSLTANAWSHLGFAFTVASTTCTLSIYLNGVLYAQYSWSTATAALTSSQVKMIIGGNRAVGTNNFNGYVSNVAIYNKLLTVDQFLKHYVRGKGIRQNVYDMIATLSDSYWAEMLKIATADIGMYFFDELGNFVYEHGRSYDDALDTQHSVVQYTLDQNQDIVSAAQTVELHTNKVKVKVYPKMITSSSTPNIWSAASNESLAICLLASSISAYSTDSLSLSLTLNAAALYEPVWPLSGIVKIDDEYIKYTKSSGGSLFDLERGYWGSQPAYHATGSIVGEAREYNLEWSNQPVYFVKYPFITAVIYDKTVVASSWRFNGQKGYIRLFPSNAARASDKYIVLEGTNPVTKLNNYFVVSGIVGTSSESSKQTIVEVLSDYKDNIRKYGEKILEIDNPLIQDAEYAKDLAQFLLAKYSIPCPVLQITTMGIPQLQLGDRIKIQSLDGLSLSNDEYWIMSINMSYDGGISQTMTLRKVS